MHHIHRTKAFVLKTLPIKEADTQIVLLTEDFGVIKAVAQGSRKIESKMRQSIQDYSLVNVALVSGRIGWRLVNAVFIKNFSKNIEGQGLKESIYKIFSLIDRLIVDELEDREVFEIVSEFVDFAETEQNSLTNIESMSSFEAIFLAKILNNLGYLVPDGLENYLKSPISLELIQSLNSGQNVDRGEFVKEINRAIRDSNL